MDNVENHLCPKCQRAVPADAPHGLCPACLSLILGEGADLTGAGPFAVELGPYELLNEVGRGGAGVVFRARDQRNGELVALKVLTAGRFASAAERERFAREAQAVANLKHPGIVPFLDLGEIDGQPYLAMRWIEGQPLSQRARRELPSLREAVETVCQAARAIQYAHERGVIHRDLKPSNILLTPAGEICLVDFGLARHLTQDATVTRSGEALGTPGFMPPEQCGEGRVLPGPAADVYSLGSVLYFLLTGRPPFMAATHHETVAQLLRDEPVPPRRLNPAIPRDLETICLKCLEKSPQSRYATAAFLADDLERYGRGERIQARPVGRLSRSWRWVRRHRTAAVSAALILGMLTAFLWQTWRTLHRLRDTAPALIALSESLLEAQRLPEALERIEVALRLQPRNPHYLLLKGNLQQALLDLHQARDTYSRALKHSPTLKLALTNLALCEDLIRERGAAPELSGQLLTRLYEALVSQSRSAEAYAVSKHIDAAEKQFVADLQQQLTRAGVTNQIRWEVHQPSGLERGGSKVVGKPRSVRYLALDLDQNPVADLSVLRGIPLNELNLGNVNTNLSDLSPLRGMPLVRLTIGVSQVADLSPLTSTPLEFLWITFSRVTDLGPLRRIPTLRELLLSNCDVRDFSPLRGLALESLHFGSLLVTSLEPLRGMPIETLAFGRVNITDLGPLAGMPLRDFWIHHVPVSDLSPLAGLPLRSLVLNDCPRIMDLSPIKQCKTLERLVLPPNASEISFLRQLPHLKEISRTQKLLPAAEFWETYSGGVP